MNALFSFWKKSFVVGELFIASALAGVVGAQDTSDQTALEPEPIDVINSVTYDLGDHLVEFQEVTEITIPSPPPETQATAPKALTPVQQAQFEAWRAEQPASKSLAVAGAVNCSSNHPPRTFRRDASDVPGRFVFNVRNDNLYYIDSLFEANIGIPTADSFPSYFTDDGSDSTIPTGVQAVYLWSVPPDTLTAFVYPYDNPLTPEATVWVQPGTSMTFTLTVRIEHGGIVATSTDTIFIDNQ